MKVTRDILDNGKKIIHIQYTKKEIAEAKKRAEQHKAEMEAKRKAELEARK